MIDNEIYHHGILGMRWGVRRKNRIESAPHQQVSNENADIDKPRNKPLAKYSSGRKYATTTIAGAVGAMSVNMAAHALFRKKYKSGKEFVANMANSALFGASIGSLAASVRIADDANK